MNKKEPQFHAVECNEELKDVFGHADILLKLLSVIGGLKKQSKWCRNLKRFVKRSLIFYGSLLSDIWLIISWLQSNIIFYNLNLNSRQNQKLG